MKVLKEKLRLTNVIRIHPLGAMNVCSRFHGSPSNHF